MTIVLAQETNLVGQLSAPLEADAMTAKAMFWSEHDKNIARIPQNQKMTLVLDGDNDTREEILISSHTTDAAGVTTLEIETRNIVEYGITQETKGSGEYHHTNASISCNTSHWAANILQAYLQGEITNDAGVKDVLQENGDTKIFLGTSYILRKVDGTMFFSENGTSESPLGGAGNITAGDGIDLTAGELKIDLVESTPLIFTGNKLDIVTTSAGGGIPGRVAVTSTGGLLAKSILQNAISTNLISADTALPANIVNNSLNEIRTVRPSNASIVEALGIVSHSGAMMKKREVSISAAGTYRIFGNIIKSGNWAGSAAIQIYKNGVAHGTITYCGSDTVSQKYSEDLTFEAGDLIQVYIGTSGAQAANFSCNLTDFIVGGHYAPAGTLNL